MSNSVHRSLAVDQVPLNTLDRCGACLCTSRSGQGQQHRLHPEAPYRRRPPSFSRSYASGGHTLGDIASDPRKALTPPSPGPSSRARKNAAYSVLRPAQRVCCHCTRLRLRARDREAGLWSERKSSRLGYSACPIQCLHQRISYPSFHRCSSRFPHNLSLPDCAPR
jgi:hypothetical protein